MGSYTKSTLVLVIALSAAGVQAQAVAIPDPGETVALDAGERAPFVGMLMRDSDVFAIQSAATTCQLTLASERTLASRILEGRLAQEQARTHAAEQTTTLRVGLWRTEAERLARELAAAQARASEPWVSPWLWGAIGLVVGVAVSIALALLAGG